MQRKSKYKSQHIFIFDYRNRFRRCNAQTLIFSMRNLGQCVWKSTFLTLVRILDEFAKCNCDRGPAGHGVASRFVSVSVYPLFDCKMRTLLVVPPLLGKKQKSRTSEKSRFKKNAK